MTCMESEMHILPSTFKILSFKISNKEIHLSSITYKVIEGPNKFMTTHERCEDPTSCECN